MYVIVVGCGRLGSRLAEVLSKQRHDVVVIDNDAGNFARLTNCFDGIEFIGIPIDEDVLKRAGIERADALVAVTADDNVNVMVAQIAKEIYGVSTVLTRISDPEREEFYRRLGLSTVCPTNTGIDQIISLLRNIKTGLPINVHLDSRVLPVTPSPEWIGRPIKQIELAKNVKFGALVRRSKVLPFNDKETVQADDTLLLVFQS